MQPRSRPGLRAASPGRLWGGKRRQEEVRGGERRVRGGSTKDKKVGRKRFRMPCDSTAEVMARRAGAGGHKGGGSQGQAGIGKEGKEAAGRASTVDGATAKKWRQGMRLRGKRWRSGRPPAAKCCRTSGAPLWGSRAGYKANIDTERKTKKDGLWARCRSEAFCIEVEEGRGCR